jgi:hypothetical protein
MPVVVIVKGGRYTPFETGAGRDPDPSGEVEILARVEANLGGSPLAGFVGEGVSPYGTMTPTMMSALKRAVYSGMPVVLVGRGRTGGRAYRYEPTFVAGDNLTATKARLLLMAAMLKLGAPPPAVDPARPTADEVAATMRIVQSYQAVFDTH